MSRWRLLGKVCKVDDDMVRDRRGGGERYEQSIAFT